jgi:signal peptidase I
MLKLLRVSGSSLVPLYRDGDFVLVSKIPYLFGAIKQEDVVAFRHRLHGTMIKKVQSVAPHKGEIYVVGTQELSVDSRHFGPISKRDVLGKVIWHIKKPTHLSKTS